jgi:hypothetical protein
VRTDVTHALKLFCSPPARLTLSPFLCHPGANYFLFSPGLVSNYSLNVGYDVAKLDLYEMTAGVPTVQSLSTCFVWTGVVMDQMRWWGLLARIARQSTGGKWHGDCVLQPGEH